jgi:hypothetical protein
MVDCHVAKRLAMTALLPLRGNDAIHSHYVFASAAKQFKQLSRRKLNVVMTAGSNHCVV